MCGNRYQHPLVCGDITYIHTWPYLALPGAIFEYTEGWYKTRRLHSTLGYLSPASHETVMRQAA